MRFGPKKEEPIPPDDPADQKRGAYDHRRRFAFRAPQRTKNEEIISRYSLGERVNHWIGALCLYLSVDDRPGVLVAVSILVGCGRGRRSDGKILASMAGPDFCGIALLDV